MAAPAVKKPVYVEGDIFAALKGVTATTFVPHVCNDRGAFGAGFVVPLKKHYPDCHEAYMKWSSGNPPHGHAYPDGDAFRLGGTQIVEVSDSPKIFVCNMVAQTLGGVRPLYYNMLARCMDAVARSCVKEGGEVRCPLFGAGLAGGDWAFVEKLVEDCWLRRQVSVTVHYIMESLPPGWTPPSV